MIKFGFEVDVEKITPILLNRELDLQYTITGFQNGCIEVEDGPPLIFEQVENFDGLIALLYNKFPGLLI